jgi:hypothetical protein
MGLLSNAVWRLKLSWICKEIKERSLGGSNGVREREGESCCLSTWERMVALNLVTIGGRREGINTSLVPMVS